MKQYTENNIEGLSFKVSTGIYTIGTLDPDGQRYIHWDVGGKPTKTPYRVDVILKYLNDGSWIPIVVETKINDLYPIY